jgi:hypothetical protein
MIPRVRKKLTYSNVLASLALFVALGGVAVAAGLPNNSIGARKLKNGAVTTKKLRKQAVTAHKIASGSVTGAKLAAGAVGSGALANGAVTGAKLANGAVTGAKLGTNAVTSAKLANDAVTNSKIANGVVGTNKLGSEVVTTEKLKNGSVTPAKLSAEVISPGGNLRAGQTLRGQFAVGGADAQGLWTAQSFAFPLAAAPKSEVIDPATATTANCPGITGATGQNPQAAAGYLCLYVTSKVNLAVGKLVVPGVALTRLGFAIEGTAEAAGNFYGSGQWAVTAP